MKDQDILFMYKALKLAYKAQELDEVPIGALVVNQQGLIIGRGFNKTETSCSQIYHAEARAIAQAGKKQGDWRLDYCTLYVTLEPCMMCFALCGLSRIERVVYGAESPLFGYHLDKQALPDLYKKHIKGITGGILADEAQLLLKQFFKQKREYGEHNRRNKKETDCS